MKKKYETPESRVYKLELEDVITTSDILINGGDGDNPDDIDFGEVF